MFDYIEVNRCITSFLFHNNTEPEEDKLFMVVLDGIEMYINYIVKEVLIHLYMNVKRSYCPFTIHSNMYTKEVVP